MSFKSSLLSSALCAALLSPAAFAETFQFDNATTEKADTLVLFYGKGQANKDFARFDKSTNGQLSRTLEVAKFKGDFNKFVTVLAPNNKNYDRIVVVGTGDKPLSQQKLTKLGGNLSGKLKSKSIKRISVASDDLVGKDVNAAAYFAHGVNLRSYTFDKYHKEKRAEKAYFFDVKDSKATKKVHTQLANIEKGVFLARDLTSEVATEMTPVEFAAAAKELEKYGVKVTVLTPKEIKAKGMGALEAVGRGSKQGSRLVVAHYEGSKDAPIAIVGKGITFDSGGYSIKTGSSIARMKSDMAGAAAVLGTVKAMALNKEKVNVVAVMGMAANMVSENSVAPGDVVKTAEGLTVEIVNTDAEGRLVLSDAMWYAREHYKPQAMVDVATLTGSKVRAVGNDYAAVFSADDSLVKELTVAGKQVNENLWRLPLDYKEMLKTDIADLQNVGKGGPGASTAASFLEHFAGDVRWAHIDIAGNALSSKAKGEVSTGGTGYGVRLLSQWLVNNK